MNSTKGTDQTESMLNSFDTSLRKSEGLKTIKQREPIEWNKLVLSTSVPIKPTKDESYEWCRFFQMHFDRDWSEKDKSFTVSLYRTKRNKNRCEKIGQSRSFFLVHLKHQELKELSLEFKESYESKWEGKVIMRMQYVNDELSLYTQILEENLKRRDLIIKWIDILTLQIQGYREGMERSIGFDIAENRNLEWGSFNAAYYSEYWNDSVLESDSSFHKNRILKTDHIE